MREEQVLIDVVAYARVEEQQPYSGPVEPVLVTSRVVLSLILKSENNLIS